MESMQFQLPGAHLAALKWGIKNAKQCILFFHGWMDNAYSFYHYFDETFDSECYAIEHIGHCQSSSIPSFHATMNLLDWLAPLVDIIDYQLPLPIHLVAHSFSGGLATLLAGLLPERIKSLTLIDPVMWSSDKETDLLGSFQAIRKYRNRKGELPKARGFQNQKEAVKGRIQHGVTPQNVAEVLAIRGLEKAENGLWYWKTDTRVRFSKVFLMHHEHIERVWDQTQATVQIFGSSDPRYGLQGLIGEYAQRSFCEKETWQGSHYLHFEYVEELKKRIHKQLKA